MVRTYIPSDNRTEANLPQAREDGKSGKDQRGNQKLPIVEHLEDGRALI